MRILGVVLYYVLMKKDFDTWNIKKKKLDIKKGNPIFREGDIWWSYYGVNVGGEAYGKGEDFRRPVIILKKITENSCIVIPTTTKIKEGKNFFAFTENGEVRRAMLYQVKFISAKRLYVHKPTMHKDEFLKLKESLAKLLGIHLSSPDGQKGQCLDHWVSPSMDTYYQNCSSCQIEAGLMEYNALLI